MKVSRTEKELFEEFLKTEEPDVAGQMQQYFAQAKEQPGGIMVDNREVWSKIEKQIDGWLADVCGSPFENGPREQGTRSHHAPVAESFAQTIRDELGGRRAS